MSWRQRAGIVGVTVALSACSTLPSSGPTAGQIKSALKNHNETNFSIVDIDPATTAVLTRDDEQAGGLAALASDGRVDTLGPGDVLNIGIYEVGVTLFAGQSNSSGQGGTFNPSARGTDLQRVVVASDGTITLPYVGRIEVAGKTTAEVQRTIERGLRGLSQRPQALVSVENNAFNVVYVSGDVREPGRYELGLPRERLLDALTRAKGTTNQPDDMVVRITRGDQSAEARLSSVSASGPQNISLLPGDRVELFNRPRTFLVFGATDKVSQVAFGANRLSLAEALARIGGPSDNVADPSAIFLFRYAEANDAVPVGEPVIYRLNMLRPDSYFLSQRVEMRDKDVIYIASAASNQPGKLATILGQLFTPIIAARAITR